MANQGHNANYRPGVNRAITKKWAEAKAINYDDWDDSDGYDPEEPVLTAPGHSRQQSWDNRSRGGYPNPSGQYYPSNRSVTGPASTGRTSFDRGDERRHFSNVGGAQGPYPTAQRDPFEETQPHFDPSFNPQVRGYREQPSLQLQTGGRPSMDQSEYQQGPYPQGPYTAGPTGHQFQEPRGAPFSAPIMGPGRRSHSIGRPAPGDIFPPGEGPMRPGSQNSRGGSPNRAFPPRKSSLSQQQPPPEIQQYGVMGAPPVAQASTPSSEAKALPFIRPADIYKRMEEEKDKERRSQESSRPSFESATSRIRGSSVGSHRTGTEPAADPRSNEAVDEPDTTRKLQPTLPPVAERKSEYGFDNMIQNASPDFRASTLDRSETGLSKASEASSDYTNRAEPTSASTLNSRQLPFETVQSPREASNLTPPQAHFLLPAVRGVSDFGNDMFGQRKESQSASQLQPSSTAVGPREESMAADLAPGSNLQHQNSLGYRSMVNQAFDQSQEQVPPTPVSMSDSVARSNSASASDISPIMGRSYEPPASQPVIPEESNSRPGTSGTQHSVSRSVEKELPPPPAIVPGYRRDSSPAPSENPEKRPLSIQTADMPKGEHAIPSAATSSTASWDKDSERGPAGGDVPLMTDEPAPPSAETSTHLEKPSELSRTTSEDWREWENSRKQFKTQHGVQESIASTPDVPSPISRADSPSKGLVRDIADKLESRDFPAVSEPTRPSNARLESFRPSLPGGWQSYTTNTGTATPQEKESSETQSSAAIEEEEIPKAGPPKDHSAFTGTSETAFAALAASGSALAGAFGISHAVKEQNQSRDIRAGNSRTSTSMSKDESEAGETPVDQDRQLETISEGDHRSPASTLPPTPLPKDTPSEADAGRSTLDYFPAPLTVRQSRGADQLTPQRPNLPATLSTETSPQDDANDRLRKEIVKSLTPKSSQYEDSSMLLPGKDTFPITSGSQRTVSTTGDSNLPKEYDSYWDESNKEPSHQADFDAATPKAPPVPEHFEANTTNVPSVPESKAVSSSAEADMPRKTTIEQRFSWETAGEQTPPANNVPPRADSLQDQGSPETIKAPTFASTSVPISATTSKPTIADPSTSSEALRPAPSAKVDANKGLPQLIETHAPSTSNAAHTITSPNLSFKERPFKDVLAMSSPQDRIEAFNTHRQHYATNEEGGLAQWLQAVGSSHPEHATVMSANGVPTLRDDGTELHRPSPARLGTKFRMPSSNYTGSGEASGTKQIQEDGKRLLQAGGKLGKKGGLAAKGLLAKAKDKARAVSSSDKATLQSRRRSSQLAAAPTEEVQHSSYPSSTPQIPSQKLEISPVDHDDWSLPYGTPIDSKKLDWENPSPIGTGREVASNRISETPSTVKSETPRGPAESFATPAPFIGHVIPSNEEQSRALPGSTPSSTGPPKADHQTLRVLEQAGADPTSTSHENRVPLAIAASVPIAAAAVVVADHEHLSTDQAGVERSNGLAAPRHRESMISNVSSPSPNPEDQQDRSRSISPPRRSILNENGKKGTNAPSYTQHFPPTKVAEAEEERAQAEAMKGEEQLPTYEQPGREAPSRLGDNPQIVPVADLSSQRRDEGKPIQARPFSFAGPEALERMTSDTSQTPAVGEALNKRETNVSVDEVTDDVNGARNKSFHRPFGTGQEPSVHEHPAFRNPDPTDRSRLYSTENPLPSARRDQSSPVFGQNSALTQQHVPREGEEGYRIPGPYVQEYRSPTGRQNVAPFDARQGNTQFTGGPPRTPQTTRDRATQGFGQPSTVASQGRDVGLVQQRPEQERSRSRPFGGLFKRDKSHTSDQNTPRSEKKERRESFFTSRQNSVSSQGSRLGALKQTPSREQQFRQNSNEAINQRGSSRDLLRSSTGGNDDEFGRKKRFSGIGGFFGKSSSNAKKGSAVNAHHQNAPMQQSAYQDTRQQQQVQRASTSVPNRTFSGHPVNETPYHLRATNSYRTDNLRANTAPTGGYDGTYERQYPVSAFPHGPDSVMLGHGNLNPSLRNPSLDRGFVQNPTGAYSAAPQPPQSFDQRPLDLRINTMRTQSPNNSYMHNFPSTRAPNSAGTGIPATTRAIDLHKRSRSPKLGRHSSSEDLTQRNDNDPAANLGTFSSKSRSPHTANTDDAAQEKPWAISLPTDVEENRKTKVLQRSESAGNQGAVAELEGSKANGYESEEEIVMSATALPGDQWMPDAMDYAHGHYD